MSSNSHPDLGLADRNTSCSCCVTDSDTRPVDNSESISSAAQLTDYLVDGMTCSHCVSSVSRELGALDGVGAVTVELKAGGPSRVTVASTEPISDAAIRAAVEAAGYTLSVGP